MIRFRRRYNKRLDVNQRAVVYKMICPVTNEIVYIGYTVNYKLRISYHLNNGFERNKKAVFIKSLKQQGLLPKFEIIKEFNTVTEAKDFEEETIAILNPVLNTRIKQQCRE